MHRKKGKIYFVFVRLAVAAVCKSKVISLVANIHASARAICVCRVQCILVCLLHFRSHLQPTLYVGVQLLALAMWD
jgi:hypothetical protein